MLYTKQTITINIINSIINNIIINISSINNVININTINISGEQYA